MKGDKSWFRIDFDIDWLLLILLHSRLKGEMVKNDTPKTTDSLFRFITNHSDILSSNYRIKFGEFLCSVNSGQTSSSPTTYTAKLIKRDNRPNELLLPYSEIYVIYLHLYKFILTYRSTYAYIYICIYV